MSLDKRIVERRSILTMISLPVMDGFEMYAVLCVDNRAEFSSLFSGSKDLQGLQGLSPTGFSGSSGPASPG